MKMILAIAIALLVQWFVSGTLSAQTSAGQHFLPLVQKQPVGQVEPLDYVAEPPVAQRPVDATLQVDVFDRCGDCGADHRLPDVILEIVYLHAGAIYSTTRVTNQEGVVKFYEPYEILTVRIIADPTHERVTSSVVNLSSLAQDPTGAVITRWGITFKRNW